MTTTKEQLNVIQEISNELNNLNSRVNWAGTSHFQSTFKNGQVVIHDTSKYSREHKIQGEHIVIGCVDYEECLTYLKIKTMILIVNDLYYTDYTTKWNCDNSFIELYNYSRLITTGSTLDIKKAFAKECLSFVY